MITSPITEISSSRMTTLRSWMVIIDIQQWIPTWCKSYQTFCIFFPNLAVSELSAPYEQSVQFFTNCNFIHGRFCRLAVKSDLHDLRWSKILEILQRLFCWCIVWPILPMESQLGYSKPVTRSEYIRFRHQDLLVIFADTQVRVKFGILIVERKTVIY